MPSLKMKTKSIIGCLKEKYGLHVCQKSSMISKNPLSHDRVAQNAEIGTYTQSSQDGKCGWILHCTLQCFSFVLCASHLDFYALPPLELVIAYSLLLFVLVGDVNLVTGSHLVLCFGQKCLIFFMNLVP